MALRQDYRECIFFCFADSITLFKKLIRKKVSHLTCILIEGTFPSTNQHPCIFSCFKRPSTHMQDALENVFAQREIIFTHRLTLDESSSCPSRPAVCSWGHDVWFIDRRHLYSRLLKKNFAVEIIPKEEQGWKSIRKWADIWRSANSVQQIRKWRAYCDPCTTTVCISDNCHPREWPPRFKF